MAKGRAVRTVFDAGSVVSPWTYGKHLILLPQMSGLLAVITAVSPFGKFSN